MKIIICASLSAINEILDVDIKLKAMGHTVEIPEGAKHKHMRPKEGDGDSEKAGIKIQHDLIRAYYKKIKNHDAVLVVNVDKRGIKNYIGGNSFLEMGLIGWLSTAEDCALHVCSIQDRHEV